MSIQEVQHLVNQDKLAEASQLAKLNAIDMLQSSALIYQKMGQYEESVRLAKMCLKLEPNNAKLYGNLSFFLGNQMKCKEALQANEKAYQIEPKIEFLYNKAVLLSSLKRLDESIKCYRGVLQEKPDYHLASFNLGCMLIMNGEFAEGHKLLESRFLYDGELNKFRKRFSKPNWDGVSGKKLLIFSEQGIGDAIQYLRYIPQLKEKGYFLVAELQEELEDIFKGFFDITYGRAHDYKLNNPDDISDHEYVVSFSSLPLLLDTDLKNIPNEPYLFADPYQFDNDKFKIGICWAGSALHSNDLNRSMPVKHLLPLKKLPVQLYSLQKGDTKRAWGDLGDGSELELIKLDLNDIRSTMGYIAGMDLIITVDTAVAHLAGAMGKPVYMMLSFCHDHRWLKNKRRTLWYPSMKLFRQRKIGDWDGVVEKVIKELKI